MTLDRLVNIRGDLREAYNKAVAGTVLHADQLMDERRTRPVTPERDDLRDQSFYTADGHGYFSTSDGDIEWAITREADNLVLRHLNDAVNSSYDQLVNTVVNTGNYRPDNTEAQAAKNADGTVVVKMNQLRLSGTEKEWRYLQIRTKDGFIQTEDGYQVPNAEEQKAMTRLGYTPQNLHMLKEAGKTETKIYILNPTYVHKKITADRTSDSLWRASWLNIFISSSNFDASDRIININDCVRGVRKKSSNDLISAQESDTSSDSLRREVAAGDAAKIGKVPRAPVAPSEITPTCCYDFLLSDEERAIAALNDTRVAGLSRILAGYRATRRE